MPMFDHDRIEELFSYTAGLVIAVRELTEAVAVLAADHPVARAHVDRARTAAVIADRDADLRRAVGEERWRVAPDEAKRAEGD